jgi:hypothetical protein
MIQVPGCNGGSNTSQPMLAEQRHRRRPRVTELVSNDKEELVVVVVVVVASHATSDVAQNLRARRLQTLVVNKGGTLTSEHSTKSCCFLSYNGRTTDAARDGGRQDASCAKRGFF